MAGSAASCCVSILAAAVLLPAGCASALGTKSAVSGSHFLLPHMPEHMRQSEHWPVHLWTRVKSGVTGNWGMPLSMQEAKQMYNRGLKMDVCLGRIFILMAISLCVAIGLGAWERRAKALDPGGIAAVAATAAKKAKAAEATLPPGRPAPGEPGPGGRPSPAGEPISVLKLYTNTMRLLWAWLTDPRARWTARGLVLGLTLWWLVREYCWAFMGSAYHAEATNQVTTITKHKNAANVWHAILAAVVYDIFIGLGTFSILHHVVAYFPRIHLRDFMTQKVLNAYLMGNHHAYYHIKLNESENGIDNPDQRIVEDVDNMSHTMVSLWGSILSTVFGCALWTSVIFGLGGTTVVQVSFAFAGLRTLIAWFGFGRGIVAARIDVLKEQAFMRYALTRIRDSAEEIAMCAGNAHEYKHITSLYVAIKSSIWKLTTVQVRYGMATHLCDLFPGICLWAVLLPKLVSEEIGFGDAVRVHMGYDQVNKVFGFLVNNFDALTDLHANAERLQILLDACEAPDHEKTMIQFDEAPQDVALKLQGVTPYHRSLKAVANPKNVQVPGLSLLCPSGQGLLIMGPSGSGKTSLLRVMAGLSPWGLGSVKRPGGSVRDFLQFLPTRCYLPVGSLQQLVCYPHWLEDDDTSEDKSVKQSLVRARLSHLVDRWGLSVKKDWRAILSTGEQQRLGFARLFWQLRARKAGSVLAVLDEATSALDVETEAVLYSELHTELQPGGGLRGLVSVGHRPQLQAFHDTWLLLGDGPELHVHADLRPSARTSGVCLSPGGETMRWRQLVRKEEG